MEQDKLVSLLETALQALADAQQLHLRLAGTAGQAQAAAPATPAVPLRTLGEWLTVHEAALHHRGYKPQTIKNRRAIIAHVRRLWGAQPITQLKPHEVAAGLRDFGAKRSSTAKRVLFELRDVYAEAVAHGWAEHNPATHLKSPVHKVKRARLTFQTFQAMHALAQASPQTWLQCLLLLALVTGQRRADLAKARFDDIVTDAAGHQFLRIEQQKQAGKGYGARIELPLTLRLDALGITLADVIALCRTSGKPGATLLRKAGGGAIEESSLSTRFHECIVAVLGEGAHQMHQWPSLHEVRSLAARIYRAQGCDVQTLLGHKHAEMTAVYEDDRGLSAQVWKRLEVAA